MSDVNEPTVIELAESVRRGERKAIEVLDEYLMRIEAGNERLNAFVHIDADLAREAAVAVDEAVARGDDPGPLAGVPFGVKDLERCKGMPTDYGSVPFAGRGPEADDDINVARLKAAGAVAVGKTSTPEFGTLNFTKTKVHGITRNPWDTARTPGGSSGGTAAAVAAGIIPFGTASDGGGSIRIPAAFSGLLGHKCSHGRIPLPGPTGNNTSVRGSLTTTVADTARILDVLAGPDDRDRFSLPPSGITYEDAIETTEVRGLRARWSLDLGFATVDPEVAEIVRSGRVSPRRRRRAGGRQRARGVRRSRAGLADDRSDHVVARGRAGDVAVARGRLHVVDAPVARADREHDAADLRAVDHAHASNSSWTARACSDDVDVVLCPTTAVPAFPAEGPPPSVIAGVDTGNGAMSTPFTMLANLCWNPAISIPCGQTADGLPVGLQVIARRHLDEIPLRLARIFEQLQPWPRYAPAP